MHTETSGTKRQRHLPVKNASNIYKSQRADGTWVYEIRRPMNAEGKRPFEVVGTGAAGLNEAKELARKVHGANAPRVSAVAVTLAAVVEHWQRTRVMRPRSAETYDQIYRTHIAPSLARRKVRDLDKGAVQTWLNNLQRRDGRGDELAQGTKRLILSCLEMLLAHAVSMGALGAVPKLDRGGKPKASPNHDRVLSHDEEVRLLLCTANFKWMKPIIIVALNQALRLGEVCGLQWTDIDFAAGTITVRHSLGRNGVLGPTKGGSAKVIALMPAAREVLLDLRMKDAEGLVFKNSLGGPRQLRDVQRAFAKAVTYASLLPGVTFHTLRHTAATRLANNPAVTIWDVKDFLRHSSIVITQRYVHATHDASKTANMAAALTGVAA